MTNTQMSRSRVRIGSTRTTASNAHARGGDSETGFAACSRSKKVNVFGERPERIFVQFSYDRIATLGVSARDIFDALVGQNTVTPSGSIDTQNQQVYIRLDGALNDLEKIRDTPIISGGRTLRLSDIADVQRGYEDPARSWFVTMVNLP